MSWASRRRTQYAFGVFIFILIFVGGPLAYHYLSQPPTCTDGLRNQGETAVDKGGPCPLLDENSLTPAAVLWSRSFRVRDGSYNAVALIQNPNPEAGARSIQYQFGLYDERNVLIAEKTGLVFLMPGSITPVFEGSIDTGSRTVAHTYFDIASGIPWERLADNSIAIEVTNVTPTDFLVSPRITADVRNADVATLKDIRFVAVVYDPAGNAFAASQTALTELGGGASRTIIFTWPTPLTIAIGRIQILPLVAPSAR